MFANVKDDSDKSDELEQKNKVVLNAKIELELSELPEAERAEYVKELGIGESGLDALIKKAYEVLGLLTFSRAARWNRAAWTIKKGAKAPQAAGVIHTDFEKGFIRAEVIGYDDFIKYNGELGARDAGRLRLEGKEYVVQDGDVCHFRFAL